MDIHHRENRVTHHLSKSETYCAHTALYYRYFICILLNKSTYPFPISHSELFESCFGSHVFCKYFQSLFMNLTACTEVLTNDKVTTEFLEHILRTGTCGPITLHVTQGQPLCVSGTAPPGGQRTSLAPPGSRQPVHSRSWAHWPPPVTRTFPGSNLQNCCARKK